MKDINVSTSEFNTVEELLAKIDNTEKDVSIKIEDELFSLVSCFKTIITPYGQYAVELNPLDYTTKYFEVAHWLYTKLIQKDLESVSVEFNNANVPVISFDLDTSTFI
ncbi:hypothetical protein [Pseudoalteromonas sp. BSi20495]|uniref:hypothetical protein n=1 Tax=Pseudoalteromonas sp. BSi20495 TaxID=386429 RepID=UPI00023159BF|nr:hypothetical protein [Pseudoalteromonas sp. BSi20495]GAA78190.1 hypothetical protein P20495_0681 [Pseudoalteromonas sp. BSi20495]